MNYHPFAVHPLFLEYSHTPVWADYLSIKKMIQKDHFRYFDRAIQERVSAFLKEKYASILELFRLYRYPETLLVKIIEKIEEISLEVDAEPTSSSVTASNQKGLGPTSFLNAMVEYLPTCVIIMWVMRAIMDGIRAGETYGLRKVEVYYDLCFHYYDYMCYIVENYRCPQIDQEEKREVMTDN